MPRFLFPLALLAACLLFTTARADDTPGEEAIKEAITILEARKAQTEAKEDKDRIDRAIADLEKLLPGAAKKDDDKAMVEPDLAKLITPALLRKKFAGKAAFNPKTGELTLVYDFANKDELKDFDLGDTKPKVQRGAILVDPASSITHVVPFKTLTLTGKIVVGQLDAGKAVVYIRTTENLKFWVLRVNGVWSGFSLATDKDELSTSKGIKQEQIEGKILPIHWTIQPKKTLLKIGTLQLSGNADIGSVGQVEFNGGTGGAAFGKLTLTGTVGEEWAREFFKE